METQFDNIIENSIPVSDELDTFGLISLEYSKHVEEKKTYPLDGSQPVFAVCWKEDVGRNVCSTLRPVAMPYSVSKRFPLGCRTQLHTHDYIELGYVISGTFRQSILGKEVVYDTPNDFYVPYKRKKWGRDDLSIKVPTSDLVSLADFCIEC